MVERPGSCFRGSNPVCALTRVPETGRAQTVTVYDVNRDAVEASAKALLGLLVPHRRKEEEVLYPLRKAHTRGH